MLHKIGESAKLTSRTTGAVQVGIMPGKSPGPVAAGEHSCGLMGAMLEGHGANRLHQRSEGRHHPALMLA